jgi:hypothetical protein
MIFEKSDRSGGMINSYKDSSNGNVVELSAAFILPDYYEVTSLLNRYSHTLLPLNSTVLQYHITDRLSFEDIALSPTAWYYDAVSRIVGSDDSAENDKLVAVALAIYLEMHANIFGVYSGRFPPKPQSDSALIHLKGSFMDFLNRFDIGILAPLMLQVFSIQVSTFHSTSVLMSNRASLPCIPQVLIMASSGAPLLIFHQLAYLSQKHLPTGVLAHPFRLLRSKLYHPKQINSLSYRVV